MNDEEMSPKTKRILDLSLAFAVGVLVGTMLPGLFSRSSSDTLVASTSVTEEATPVETGFVVQGKELPPLPSFPPLPAKQTSPKPAAAVVVAPAPVSPPVEIVEAPPRVFKPHPAFQYNNIPSDPSLEEVLFEGLDFNLGESK